MERGTRSYSGQQHWAGAGLVLALLASQGVHFPGGPLPTGEAVGSHAAALPAAYAMAGTGVPGALRTTSAGRSIASAPKRPTSVALGKSGDDYWGVTWSPNGRWIATVASQAPLRIWDARTREPFRALRPAVDLLAAAWSPDGRHLALSTGAGWIHLYETAQWRRVRRMRLGEAASILAWHPQGRLIAGAVDSRIHLWDATTGRRVRRLVMRIRRPEIDPGEGCITELPQLGLAWSPDGTCLVHAGADRFVRIWSVATGRLLRRCEAGEGDTSGVAWSPDGKLLASGNWLGGVTLWNAETGKRNRAIRDALGGLVYSVAFSPDGRRLAVGGDPGGAAASPIRIYEVARARLTLSLHGHTYAVHSLAWSPTGTALASVSMAHETQPSFRLWSLAGLGSFRPRVTGR